MHETGDSHCAAILAHLRAGGTITRPEAMELFGSFHLGGRIHELRRLGYPILAERVALPSGKRVARYSLAIDGRRAGR